MAAAAAGLLMTLAALLASACPAAAMTFQIKRGGECDSRVCIQASGEIGDHAAENFTAFMKAHHIGPGALLVLDSPGGSLTQGLALGARIRKAGLSTAVQTPGGVCASACVYAFLGGVERSAVHGARLGVHQVYGRIGGEVALQVSDAQMMLSLVAIHIRRMGAKMDLLTLALGTPPEHMYWLSDAELARFAVVTA